MTYIGVDVAELDDLAASMDDFGAGAGAVVQGVLADGAGETIVSQITPLINPSGRTFKGHNASATVSDWATTSLGTLSVTVKSRSKYRYLYFPDDGTDTVRHAGNQRFMERGAEAASPEIVERCIDALASTWKE